MSSCSCSTVTTCSSSNTTTGGGAHRQQQQQKQQKLLRQQASDDEEKCLLTPTSQHSFCPFEQQDDDCPHRQLQSNDGGMDDGRQQQHKLKEAEEEEQMAQEASQLRHRRDQGVHGAASAAATTGAGAGTLITTTAAAAGVGTSDECYRRRCVCDVDDPSDVACGGGGVAVGGGDCCSMGACSASVVDYSSLASPLIYSEPALPSAFTNGAMVTSWAHSEMALPQGAILGTCPMPLLFNNNWCNDADQQQQQNHHQRQRHPHNNMTPNDGTDNTATTTTVTNSQFGASAGAAAASRAVTPKSSSYFLPSESQPSIGTSSVLYLPHKQSFSIGEIRDTHMQIQKRYRPSRRRHFTDPVDFEGILNIIGGCSWWQIWVYLLISLQQIPHAMFNLSVVYMMYQPDHWCKVPGLNASNSSSSSSTVPYQWDVSDTLHGSVVYPRTRNKQRDMLNFHSQCHYYDRGEQRYDQLRRMPLEEAQRALNDTEESSVIRKCTEWHYDQDVMRSTIVTEWNLVCDDNFKRAHAHLFYSFGFLFGCLLGGFASDRFGRKPTVIGFGILSSMFGLLLPYSTYFPMFLFIRFCGAVCNEAADLAAYVLCMEITGTRYRAMVGSLLQAPWAVGYATLALIAYFCNSWQNIQLITAALHTVSICLICVLPESPRWLIVNNRVDEAERYIRKACREPPFPFNLFKFNKSSLPCDLELVKHAEQRKWVRRNQRANILHLLKSRALCMRTGVICVVWIATALVYYGIIIALSDQSAPGRVLFSGNFFLNNAVAGAIELPTLIFCVYLMKYGRKRSQIFTLVTAAIFILFAMASMSANRSMLSLGLMLLGKIFIQGGFNILYIFTSELYPTVIRNSAVGFCSMIARFGSGVSSYIAILSDVTLSIVPMIIFATFSLFAGTLVMLLPETRDQPLPDTLQDAVTILKDNERPYQCRGFGSKFLGGSYSVSATELVSQQQSQTCDPQQDEDEEEDDGGDNDDGQETTTAGGSRTTTPPPPRSHQHHSSQRTCECGGEETTSGKEFGNAADDDDGEEEIRNNLGTILFDADGVAAVVVSSPSTSSPSSSSSSSSSPTIAVVAAGQRRRRSDNGTGGVVVEQQQQSTTTMLPSIPEEDNACRERRRGTTPATTTTTTQPEAERRPLLRIDTIVLSTEAVASSTDKASSSFYDGSATVTTSTATATTPPSSTTATSSSLLSPSSALSLLSSLSSSCSAASAPSAVADENGGSIPEGHQQQRQQQQQKQQLLLLLGLNEEEEGKGEEVGPNGGANVGVDASGRGKEEEDGRMSIGHAEFGTTTGRQQAVATQQQQQCLTLSTAATTAQFDTAAQTNMLQAIRQEDVPRVVASM